VKHRLGQLVKRYDNFLRFSAVGVVWTAVNIGTDILFVDHWHLPGWLGTLVSYLILYLGRYYSYLWLKVIEPQFWKYVYTTAAFTLVMWALKIAAIDFFGVSAALASPAITVASFILKYFFYRSINLLRSTDHRS
jgi:putative flippase GtrA